MNRIPSPQCLRDPPLLAGAFLLPTAGMSTSVRKPRSQSVYAHVSKVLLPMLLCSEDPISPHAVDLPTVLRHGKLPVHRASPRTCPSCACL